MISALRMQVDNKYIDIPGTNMSFRNLSLIFITILLTSILLLQWWSITRFTENVSRQIGESAFEVSRSTAETLIFGQPKVEFHSFAITMSEGRLTRKTLEQLLPRVKQDVTIELINEQKDDFILLNADGSDYQIPIPRTGIHQSLEDFSNNVLYSTVTLLAFGILLAIYFTSKLASPLKRLQDASVKIGEGNLGLQIEKDNKWHSKEIDTTVDSFNRMSTEIQQLQHQNEALQNKAHLAELAEIARGLAHTIRNPLNTLNLAIDQLSACDNQQEQQKLSKIAKHQITRIDKWVRSLMDVMGSDTDLVAPVNLNQSIQSVIQDIKLSTDKNVMIVFDSKVEQAQLNIIESEFKSLIQSIITNAVEASPEGAKVAIDLSHNENGFQIKVIDQGQGFSEKILDKLFTPHNTNKTYGAGMGLFLAERVIRHKYHGKITINNNADGKGANVIIWINNRG